MVKADASFSAIRRGEGPSECGKQASRDYPFVPAINRREHRITNEEKRTEESIILTEDRPGNLVVVDGGGSRDPVWGHGQLRLRVIAHEGTTAQIVASRKRCLDLGFTTS